MRSVLPLRDHIHHAGFHGMPPHVTSIDSGDDYRAFVVWSGRHVYICQMNGPISEMIINFSAFPLWEQEFEFGGDGVALSDTLGMFGGGLPQPGSDEWSCPAFTLSLAWGHPGYERLGRTGWIVSLTRVADIRRNNEVDSRFCFDEESGRFLALVLKRPRAYPFWKVDRLRVFEIPFAPCML